MNITFFFFLVLIVSCSTQPFKRERSVEAKDIPAEVHQAFYQRHFEVKGRFHQQIIGDQVSYEVSFTENGKNKSERFSKKGRLLETEEELSFQEVDPKIQSKITDYLRSNDEAEITETQRINNKTIDGYEIKTKSKKSRTGLMEYFFDMNGEFKHSEEVELVAIPNMN